MYLDSDGMLVCENAVLGKAGTQAYVGYELGLDSTEVILVHRPEREVFDEESLSSLRGKTLTLNHPDEDVSVDNHAYLSKGFVLDVRREGNLIVGDIKITDPETIKLITNKDMVELSLGYDTKLAVNESGELTQTQIVYNHLALVKKGRAEVARIVDGHKTRVVDRQFEKGGVDLEQKSLFDRILGALGLKEKKYGDETAYVVPTEEVEKTDVYDEAEPSVETKEEAPTVETVEEVQDNVQENIQDEAVEVEQEEVVEEVVEEVIEEATEETQITDSVENQEGDEDMDKLDSIVARMQKIEKIEDADFRQTLKDALLQELTASEEPTQVTDSSNEALEDFGNVKLEDSQEVEVINFDKEIKALYDNLNPHNHDSYEDYVKYRKQLNKQASTEVIQELVDEGLGGLR